MAAAKSLVTGLLLLLLTPVHAFAGNVKPEARLFFYRRPSEAEVAKITTHARFEPAVGCYLGAFIDFDGTLQPKIQDQNGTRHRDPADFEKLVAKPHAMYFFYLGYGKRLPLDWVRRLAERQKFVHIALEPNVGLKYVHDDAYLRTLADDMARSGARIFLRFASEMNGDWTRYHGDPALYRSKFQLVHDVMHRRAPNVAMVWCPYTTPDWNITAYYPGDGATDWVGINMYSVTYHNNRRGDPAESEHPCDLLDHVYKRYAARKPIMVCEFAATHFSAIEARPRPDFAARKISTMYMALARLYPRVKCINYFDGNALQFASGHASNDYGVTDDPTVLDVYRYQISSPYLLSAPLQGSEPPPVMPMPFRNGEMLSGNVRLSCWARGPSDSVGVRYRVDGALLYEARDALRWDCLWDANSIRPGRHVLSLEVLDDRGRVVARTAATFVAGGELQLVKLASRAQTEQRGAAPAGRRIVDARSAQRRAAPRRPAASPAREPAAHRIRGHGAAGSRARGPAARRVRARLAARQAGLRRGRRYSSRTSRPPARRRNRSPRHRTWRPR